MHGNAVNQLELIRAKKERVRIYTPKMKDMGWQISKKYVFFIMINSKNTLQHNEYNTLLTDVGAE